jgi:hypothetical protein
MARKHDKTSRTEIRLIRGPLLAFLTHKSLEWSVFRPTEDRFERHLRESFDGNLAQEIRSATLIDTGWSSWLIRRKLPLQNILITEYVIATFVSVYLAHYLVNH